MVEQITEFWKFEWLTNTTILLEGIKLIPTLTQPVDGESTPFWQKWYNFFTTFNTSLIPTEEEMKVIDSVTEILDVLGIVDKDQFDIYMDFYLAVYSSVANFFTITVTGWDFWNWDWQLSLTWPDIYSSNNVSFLTGRSLREKRNIEDTDNTINFQILNKLKKAATSSNANVNKNEETMEFDVKDLRKMTERSQAFLVNILNITMDKEWYECRRELAMLSEALHNIANGNISEHETCPTRQPYNIIMCRVIFEENSKLEKLGICVPKSCLEPESMELSIDSIECHGVPSDQHMNNIPIFWCVIYGLTILVIASTLIDVTFKGFMHCMQNRKLENSKVVDNDKVKSTSKVLIITTSWSLVRNLKYLLHCQSKHSRHICINVISVAAVVFIVTFNCLLFNDFHYNNSFQHSQVIVDQFLADTIFFATAFIITYTVIFHMQSEIYNIKTIILCYVQRLIRICTNLLPLYLFFKFYIKSDLQFTTNTWWHHLFFKDKHYEVDYVNGLWYTLVAIQLSVIFAPIINYSHRLKFKKQMIMFSIPMLSIYSAIFVYTIFQESPRHETALLMSIFTSVIPYLAGMLSASLVYKCREGDDIFPRKYISVSASSGLILSATSIFLLLVLLYLPPAWIKWNAFLYVSLVSPVWLTSLTMWSQYGCRVLEYSQLLWRSLSRLSLLVLILHPILLYYPNPALQSSVSSSTITTLGLTYLSAFFVKMAVELPVLSVFRCVTGYSEHPGRDTSTSS